MSWFSDGDRIRKLHLYVIGESASLVTEVQACFPPPHVVQRVPSGEVPGLVAEEGVRATAFSVLLFNWNEQTGTAITSAINGFHRKVVPLVALCSANQTEHAVALMMGADYVLTRPLSPLLLQARLAAFYRRLPPDHDPVRLHVREAGPIGSIDDRKAGHRAEGSEPLYVDPLARVCYVCRKPVNLTRKEFDLLVFFLSHTGVCLEREAILDTIWGIGFDTGTNVVDVLVYGLRRKLKNHGLANAIQTVRGVGYRYLPPH